MYVADSKNADDEATSMKLQLKALYKTNRKRLKDGKEAVVSNLMPNQYMMDQKILNTVP
jgi:ElaB/YqjD/DUF883 family membrane-anchored ribosome-binding protein